MSEQTAYTFPIRREHYIGIFIISLALIAYQVVLTRIFSVVLYYHFAFAGISLAMMGLTIGAEKVFQKPARFVAEHFDTEWARAAVGFSISSIALVLLFLYLPVMLPRNSPLVWAILAFPILFVIPFTYGGICITLILTRGGSKVGKLYAADLLGAALGCIGIVAALFYIDPISIILGLAALSAATAGKIASAGKTSGKAKTLAAILLVFTVVQGALYISDGAHLRVVWAKDKLQENLLFERWNAFSRVRVTPYKSATPFGWGYGREPETQVEQKWMDIDSDAGTVLTMFNGDITKLSFLTNDIINIGYAIRPVKEAVVIGVGGGRDILSALYFGVRKVTGLELNPAILEALTHTFASFTGNLQTRPDVELINAEARSWISEHRQKFDLVQISLIDTWAATAAGGLTLAENKLYTVDAWKEFLNALNPQGMLVVSRWYYADSHRGEFYRLISLAAETLKQQGIAAEHVREHILIYATKRIVTIAVSLTPFTTEEISHMNAVAHEKNFSLLASRDFAVDELSQDIASGKEDTPHLSGRAVDLSAPTDNRPFFFYMKRLSDLFSYDSRSAKITGGDGANSPALTIIAGMLSVTTFFLIYFIIKPLLRLKDPMKAAELVRQLPNLSYFALIGLGFMLIEISQMQRLMILLGHPVYGLSVVLFTLLLFGGIGSFTVSHTEPMQKLEARGMALCILLILTGILTPATTEYVKHYGILIRIIASVIVLAPIAVCMGMMFPIGMRLTRDNAPLQPWFWGVNGAASVFASILGMAISLEHGISAAYWSGVICYILCLILTFTLSRKAHEHVTP